MTPDPTNLTARQAGATLIEALLALLIFALAAIGLAVALNNNATNLKLAGVASQLLELRAATDQYVAGNYTTLLSTAASGPISIPVSTLQSAGYLPASFPTTNAYGQTFRIYLNEPSANQLGTLVTTTGGTALNAVDGGNVATMLKQGGGYVPVGSSTANGDKGSWQITLSTIVPTSSPTPSGGPANYELNYPPSTQQF